MIFTRFIIIILFCISIQFEVQAQVQSDTLYKSIPDSILIKDTDGDGVPDYKDYCINEKGRVNNQGCPDADQNIITVHYPAMLSVFFSAGSSCLSPASIKALSKTVLFLNEWPDYNVRLEGHADNTGNDESNRRLCMARIKAVRSFLQKAGVDKTRITYTIYGSKYPIGDYRTMEGQAMNRRVEILSYKR